MVAPAPGGGARPIRRAALEGALLAALLGVLAVAAIAGGYLPHADRVAAVGFLVLVGLLTGPLVWLADPGEAAAPGPWSLDLARALGIGALASVGTLLALLQGVHASEVLAGRPEQAMKEMVELLGFLGDILPVLGGLAVPFGVHAFARRRWSSLAARLAGGVGPTLALAMPLLTLGFRGATVTKVVFCAAALLLALSLPLGAALAERLERRLWPSGPA